MATTTKKTVLQKKSSANQFQARKIGVNLIITQGKDRYARKVSKEDAEVIMKKVELYNRKPTESNKKTIIRLMTPATTKKAETKERVEATVKGYKKLQKKQAKKSKISEHIKDDVMGELSKVLEEGRTTIGRMEDLLGKFANVAVPEKEISKTSSPGEY